jgi:rsbT co-antagonist protein RsbR
MVETFSDSKMQNRYTGKELIINELDISLRKKYVDLQAEDINRILELQEFMVKHVNGFIKAFVDYLSKYTQAKGIFNNQKVVDEIQQLKRGHLLAMVKGNYDRAYVDDHIKLAQLFSRIGLNPKLFLGATHFLISTIRESLSAESGNKNDTWSGSFISLQKVFFLNLGIVVDVLNHESECIIHLQQEAIRELSTPVLQIRDQLLLIPIVGIIDTNRAKQITENLLRAIRFNRAKVVVIDITGVVEVDTKVANHLIQTAAAARLMGTLVIITGISPEIAQTLVTLSIDLLNIKTVRDLQEGIEEADKILGLK